MNTHYIYSMSDFLDQIITKKCWTAWRNEKRTNASGKVTVTKVPYSKIGVKSESDDPATWITLEDAEKVAGTGGFINGLGGGVGLWLGITAFGSEYCVAGVDLDTCLIPEAGLTPWAKEVIERFQTYGEISPSK